MLEKTVAAMRTRRRRVSSLLPSSGIDGEARLQIERRTVMAWFTANWFWVLIGILFIAMHVFGHGGHGGHGSHGAGDRQQSSNERERGEAQGRAANTNSAGHQH
jgi:hypothetical protein